jgi:predicted Rossmann fold flavoprotein
MGRYRDDGCAYDDEITNMSNHLIVIGGGAAGFFCAVNAARLNPALRVTILEKSSKLLSKVKVSGGGRCNVTHACFDIADMSRQYPRGQNLVKKTFHRFFTTDTIRWFEERGVKIKREADGRMFPVTDSSQSVIDCLLREANRYKVEIRMRSEVRQINLENGRFTIEAARGDREDHEIITGDFVCVASGGYPKAHMFDWLTRLGHSIQEPVPSLFTFNMPKHPLTALMGVSVGQAKIKVVNSKLLGEGPLLITHWGLSGPAVLRLSAWGARELAARNWKFGVSINWIPAWNEQTLQAKFRGLKSELASSRISSRNPFGLPQRLWEFFVSRCGIANETRWADLRSDVQSRLISQLSASEFVIEGKTTYKEEFVTAGGIRLSEVDANSMMSKIVPGLFFAGEVLDVDGITGGFNFQHAWTSGFVVAGSLKGMMNS